MKKISTLAQSAMVAALVLGVTVTGVGAANAASPQTVATSSHNGEPPSSESGVISTVEPGTTTIRSQSGTQVIGISVPGSSAEATPAELKGVPDGHFVGEGAPILSTRLSEAATTTYETQSGSQTLITIESPKASRDYRFPLALPPGASAKVEADGSVLIRDDSGRVTGAFVAPWAFDANGNSVPTSFSINEGSLVQHVEFNPATAFPVTADPTSIQWVPWPVLAISGAELRVLVGLSTAVFVGGAWSGCTFSKLTGPAAKIVSMICKVTGAGGVASAVAIISNSYRNANLIGGKCYGVSLTNPSAPLRDMPSRDCGL